MSALLTEDLVFVLPGEEMPQPVTLRGLLVGLGLERAPLVAQSAGVREWLRHNEPNVNLRGSIDRSGLVDAETFHASA